MKNKKTALAKSLLALLLSVAMLIGTTFAWFTDNVTSGGNIIKSGELDLEMYWTDDIDSGVWYDVEDDAHNTIFSHDKWEPGYTDVRYIKLVNNGNLAFNYNLTITPEGEVGKLAEVINVYFADHEVRLNQREDLSKLRAIGLLKGVLNGGATAEGTLLPEGQMSYNHPSKETIVTIAMSMITTAGNEYQEKDAGDFSITALATQATVESDSFDNSYDANATYPTIYSKDSANALVSSKDSLVPAGGVTLSGNNVKAFIPEGAKMESNSEKLSLTVTPLENTSSGITVVNSEILIPVDIHIDGLAKDNTTPVIIDLGEILPKYMNMGNYHLYHVENGVNQVMTLVDSRADLTAHNQFTYDTLTGEVSVAMASFSEVALVADTTKAWNGNVDYSWYDADKTELQIANADQLYSFAKIVGGMAADIKQDSFAGKTVKLLSDINLNYGTVLNTDGAGDGATKKIFYPVGYYNDDDKANYDDKTGIAITSGIKPFEGTFDGNGNTISNVYQNTWEMKGDHNWYAPEEQHYRDGMGIFGRVYGGTIKNLTVDNFESDGEITTTGVIASYADGATFENIAITNCNPRVYNIGNGGIVGCVGWYAKEADLKTTFKNITVDNSNKISALWGSYDVPCGGIVGQYYPTSGQTSAGSPKNAGIDLVNCHVAAQMDVYNDVCANYQYYAYRYAGMIIGSIRENTINEDGKTIPNMAGITASDCTVNYGDWNDYYYCEFEKNTMASYSEDYQFSRVDKSEIKFDENGKITCTHSHTAAEDKQAVYLPFYQLFTGYGWGVSSIGIEEFNGIKNKYILEGEHTDSVTKFDPLSAKKELDYNAKVTIGELFKVTENPQIEIVSNRVQVFVSPADENSTVSGSYTANTTEWEKGELSFSGAGNAIVTITDYFFCKTAKINVIIKERAKEVKFVSKFDGDFLYRVGNQNAVSLGSLFEAKDGVEIDNANVSVTVETLNGTAASGTYTPGATWTNGTIQFSGTGVVKVTITDNDYCTPTELNLEVVDATNATTATSATKNNVVLLNNCDVSSLEVKSGYALYGNGFTLTCNGDGSYRSAALSYGFVTVDGGTLDNVQIKCRIFPESYLYTVEMKAGSDGRYPYGYSAVVATNGSIISNSYIYGARNNIHISSGDVTIDNTVLECGSLANIHITGTNADTVTLNDVTTIQYQTSSDFDSNKKVLGFGVLLGNNESESNATINLSGDFKQYNWVSENDLSVSNSYAKTAIGEALKVSNYQYSFNGQTAVNMGIVALNQKEFEYHDERSNKADIPYFEQEISMSGYTGQVYSIIKGATIFSDGKRYDAKTDNVIPYSPIKNNVIAPSVAFNDSNDSITIEDKFENGRWKSVLSVDLDNISGGTYNFSFADLATQKYGLNLDYSVKDSEGNKIDKNSTIKLDQLLTKEYVLSISDNLIYDKQGTKTDSVVTHEHHFTIKATKTSIEPPKFTNAGTATAIRLVSKKGGDWRPAYTVLTGVTVSYWSASESKVKTIDLSTLYNSGKISSNVWTYTCDDYTLTITGGQVHSDGSKITPVVSNGTLYFASTNKAFTTGTTSRDIILTYVFTDKNDSTTWSRTEKVTYSNLSEYDYDSFKSGTLKDPSSGGSSPCVTKDTLITLADGSQKRIDEVTYSDKLLVWNFYEGKYDVAPAAIIFDHGADNNTVIKLSFNDGTVVKVVNMHQFFNADLNKLVTINADTVDGYIGNKFAKRAGNETKFVELESYSISNEYVEAWGIMTAGHYNIITEGMISADFDLKDVELFNYFEIGDDMKFDKAKMEADIEKYGLYTYDDFAEYLTYEQFVAFNVQYFKIPVGKGLYTFEGIIELINQYLK